VRSCFPSGVNVAFTVFTRHCRLLQHLNYRFGTRERFAIRFCRWSRFPTSPGELPGQLQRSGIAKVAITDLWINCLTYPVDSTGQPSNTQVTNSQQLLVRDHQTSGPFSQLSGKSTFPQLVGETTETIFPHSCGKPEGQSFRRPLQHQNSCVVFRHPASQLVVTVLLKLSF